MSNSFQGQKDAQTSTEVNQSGSQRFIPIGAVVERTGQSKCTIYRTMKQGKFPRPVHISANSVRWVSTEIDAWMLARIAERGQS